MAETWRAGHRALSSLALARGFAGTELVADRVDQVAGMDRARVKPYSSLAGEYTRVLGKAPGDYRFKTQMSCEQLRLPVHEEESTRVYKD